MKQSAGILLYKKVNNTLFLFLVHPGGPFWVNKNMDSWSIPKGEFVAGENPLEAAKREFKEETGCSLSGDFIELTPIKQRSGKLIFAWAASGDLDPTKIKSNTFKMEWPPKSGKLKKYPEIDKAGWYTVTESKLKILEPQTPLIEELISILTKSK